MFRSLINDAKSAAGALVSKYLLRASVAVPFVAAAGFGTAALTVMLVERYGGVAAYGIMAAGFAVVGLASALLVTIKEQEVEVADAEAANSDTIDVASEAATQAAAQLPLALAGTLLTSPMGARAALGAVKTLTRNLPLVLLFAIIGFLLWSYQDRDRPTEGEAADEDVHKQPAPHPVAEPAPGTKSRNGLDREAA